MANLLGLHPEVRRRMDTFAAELRKAGYGVTITSAYRSAQEQKRLYELRLTRPDIQVLPVARPGCSTHEYGAAFDLVTDFPAEGRAGLALQHGLFYGGVRDPVHYDAFGPWWRGILDRAGVARAIGHRC